MELKFTFSKVEAYTRVVPVVKKAVKTYTYRSYGTEALFTFTGLSPVIATPMAYHPYFPTRRRPDDEEQMR